MFNIFLYSPLHWICPNYVQTKAAEEDEEKKEKRRKEETRTVGEERSWCYQGWPGEVQATTVFITTEAPGTADSILH